MKTENAARIEERIAELADEMRRKVISSGRAKTEDSMVSAITKIIMEEYGEEDFAELVMPTARRKLRTNIKNHGWSQFLTKCDRQGDLWPDGLEETALSIGGVTIAFGAAESPIMKEQIRAIIDNDIKQKKAYTRNMDCLLPLDSIMEERNCTAFEAMEILRGRD